jgi:hypothetical protein
VVEVLPSALKHGVDPEDALQIGQDRAGDLLELVELVELVELDRRGGPAVIHAMRMRPQYRRLLPREP